MRRAGSEFSSILEKSHEYKICVFLFGEASLIHLLYLKHWRTISKMMALQWCAYSVSNIELRCTFGFTRVQQHGTALTMRTKTALLRRLQFKQRRRRKEELLFSRSPPSKYSLSKKHCAKYCTLQYNSKYTWVHILYERTQVIYKVFHSHVIESEDIPIRM